ncbi:hypothetical protein G6F37_008188 [Rhizopus arrhizus]|nr:hypothetical protein G6F38_007687 [Rhizopus arrhizus]KAG1155819.1 hypothetical protein G6F37_008188 [Rhizopus arrhizus]
MRVSESNKPHSLKKNVLRVVLDECRLFVEESYGSVMVRGEVVVNFSKDTPLQGPIELVFEGIQRFQTWPEIMRNRPIGSPIETKLQVIELSLLPPNSKGIMPAGIQRFPFEFPIPASLPASTYIQDRIEIFYHVSATLRRSCHVDQTKHTTFANWIEKAYHSNFKKKYSHSASLRIVRPIQSFASERLISGPSPSLDNVISSNSLEISRSLSNTSNPSVGGSTQIPALSSSGMMSEDSLSLPWNRRSLSEYQGLDEQHDQLSFSLAGRTTSNFSNPIDSLHKVHGIRYKISVDRTAIVLGTSVGIEVMVEPTFCDTNVRSILLKITENRSYEMKIPADHSWNTQSPETRKSQEGAKMVLKWAYGYQTKSEGNLHEDEDKSSTTKPEYVACNFVHQRSEDDSTMAYFDPPSPGDPNSKLFLNRKDSCKQTEDPKVHLASESEASSSSSSLADQKLINLKELNQPIKLGEYFGGRFVMPVPDCDSILHPSMDYGSIKVKHWLQLTVTLECNGEVFEVSLESPMHMLDCRVVVADDEYQTILPPPPSYRTEESNSYRQTSHIPSTFWEQREPITSVSGWGSCFPCPCELRKMQKAAKSQGTKLKKNLEGTSTNLSRRSTQKSNQNKLDAASPSLQPEWGPPPCYSEQ